MENITKTDKLKSMEKETNITLFSTAVSIISFFMLLYSQNLLKTNAVRAQSFLTAVEIIYALSAVTFTLTAIFKKKNWLWEYVAFTAVMAVGFYLMHHGVAGIPFLVKDTGDTFKVSPLAVKLSKIIQTNYVIYALWAVNVIYCVLTIVFHSVKYNKIKKIKVDKK